MNTSLTGLAKIGAVVFSSTLAALFVYDRATGGAIYRRLTEPTAVDATTISSSQGVAPLDESSPERDSPRILFSSSKSYSGDTRMSGGVLEPAGQRTENNVLIFGGGPYQPPPAEPTPPTILMSGSKSLLAAPNSPAAPSSPSVVYPQAAPIPQSPSPAGPPRYAGAPPYANSPAYANVPLTPADAGGPRAPNASPASPAGPSPNGPSRPTTIMMGTKSAPVFSPPIAQQPVQQPVQQSHPTYPPPYQGRSAGRPSKRPVVNAPLSQPSYLPAQQQAAPQPRYNGNGQVQE